MCFTNENNPDSFSSERERLNELVFKFANTDIKRFFHLDNEVYNDGALPGKTKELLGLVASLVLRCNDCIRYHILQCHNKGITTGELTETISIGLIIGGSIIIPHIRIAFEFWNELNGK